MNITKKTIAAGLLLLSSTWAMASTQTFELRYGTDTRQAATLVSPVNPSGLLVWVHDGGWVQGDKLNPSGRAVISRATALNYAVLAVNYRYANVRYPKVATTDVQNVITAAVNGSCNSWLNNRNCTGWTKARDAARKGVIVMGASAGGNLAVETAGRILRQQGSRSPLYCVASVMGPLDFSGTSVAPQWLQTMVHQHVGGSSDAALRNASILQLKNNRVWSAGTNMHWVIGYGLYDQIIPPQMVEPAIRAGVFNGPGNRVDIHPLHAGHDLAADSNYIGEVAANLVKNCVKPLRLGR